MKRCLIVVMVCFSNIVQATTFIPRSQSVNGARAIVGWQELINLCGAEYDELYSVLSVTPAFTQNFKGQKLARCLLGSDVQCDEFGNAFISFSGSQVVDRGEDDWLADYFLASPGYKGKIELKPLVRNVIFDLNYYLGLNSVAQGLYVKIHIPIVHTRWNLQAIELRDRTGSQEQFPAGSFAFFSFSGTSNLLSFLAGTQSRVVGNVSTSSSPEITVQNLSCSRWDGLQVLTRVSDIEATLGWNFWCSEKQHRNKLVGASLWVSAPAGNRPTGEFFFEPMVGDGHHFKLGVGLNAQGIWEQPSGRIYGLFFDGRVQHLFNTCQHRCFDLCGKPNSRYMLAQKLGQERLPLHINSAAADTGFEFQNEFASVANLTQSAVNVSIAAEADLTVKFSFMRDTWHFDVGYNFWARSCEKICLSKGCDRPLADGQTWALKGDAQVIGYIDTGLSFQPIRLAAVEADATIHSGTNNFINGNFLVDGGIDGVRPIANPGITNPQVLTAAVNGNDVIDNPFGPAEVTRSSNPVVFLSEKDIHVSGTGALSQTLFAHWNYTWYTKTAYTPFLGLGGQIEFAQDRCKTGCKTACGRCALDQWGIWIKGGIAFE